MAARAPTRSTATTATTASGAGGRDRLFGGAGNDRLHGGAKGDELTATPETTSSPPARAATACRGGAGDDTIRPATVRETDRLRPGARPVRPTAATVSGAASG